MQRNFDDKDFEQFVKQNADQYRMYPSEEVWKRIHSSIHTRRTWYGLGLVLLILASVVVTWVMVSSPVAKQPNNNNTSTVPSANSKKDNQLITETKPVIHQFVGATSSLKDNKFPEPLIAKNTLSSEENSLVLEEIADLTANKKINAQPVFQNEYSLSIDPEKVIAFEKQASTPVFQSYNLIDQATDDEYDPTLVKNNLLISNNKVGIERDIYPMTIESVFNAYKHPRKHKKLSWQIAFTPTISYRRLTENKSFLRNVSFASGNYSYAYLYNINSVVTHKPDMGFELGLNAGYPLTKNLKIRAGMQFNINRYGIKAFSYTNEVATIAFNGSGGRDSLNEVSKYRNFDGYNSNWLQNLYFSVSAPIGIEYNFAGNSNTQFGIAGTIQPTYIISDKAYLISTDYKNYVEVPWLVRRWNMNTGLEMYVNYSTGKLKWQVGPQVRYQLLSSFQNKYPVKENLFDFGLKVGIMLNK